MAQSNPRLTGGKWLLAAALGLGALGFVTTAAEARTVVGVGPRPAPAVVYVHRAPPPPIVEVRPVRPGPRAVWIGGYYRYVGPRFVWVTGYWEPRPRGVWVAGTWRHTPHGYVWVGGRWR
ncbi:MAG: hypothetical protein WBN97_01850 [Parvibaculum sp.]